MVMLEVMIQEIYHATPNNRQKQKVPQHRDPLYFRVVYQHARRRRRISPLYTKRLHLIRYISEYVVYQQCRLREGIPIKRQHLKNIDI